MPQPFKSTTEKISAIFGLLSALTGFITIIPDVNRAIKDSFKSFESFPPEGWLVLGGILIIFGVLLIRSAAAKRSQLLRPDALLLRKDVHSHLKGRDEEIEKLKKLVETHRLVHLIGEPGSGKSALMQSGLMPNLAEDDNLIPFYSNVWGEDWEAGAFFSMSNAIWERLDTEQRERLGFKQRPEARLVVSKLESFSNCLGRMPVIVFDQIDDYQAAHRHRFISSELGAWKSATEISNENEFWRTIEKLVQSNCIHCIFVTRSDAAIGLESLRFFEPKFYPLYRLKSYYIEPIINEITNESENESPIVKDPMFGWDRLKSRIVKDLSQEGLVLPAQLKLALLGLRSLSYLTISEYERHGGLSGLEASFIKEQVKKTSQSSGLPEPSILQLLLSLVDKKSDPPKTVPKGIIELERHTLSEANLKIKSDSIHKAIQALEHLGIIRQTIDPNKGQSAWILEHDYLCQSILHHERLSSIWWSTLDTHANNFQSVGSNWLARWRALLNPWIQIKLFVMRVLKKFRYNNHKSFALFSTFRFVPFILIISIGYYGWINYSIKQEAAQFLSEIGIEDNRQEVQQLWNLSKADWQVRRSFLHQTLVQSDRGSSSSVNWNAVRFNKCAEKATHAAIGLYQPFHLEILKDIAANCVNQWPSNDSTSKACVNIFKSLSLIEDNDVKPLLYDIIDNNLQISEYEELKRFTEIAIEHLKKNN